MEFINKPINKICKGCGDKHTKKEMSAVCYIAEDSGRVRCTGLFLCVRCYRDYEHGTLCLSNDCKAIEHS